MWGIADFNSRFGRQPRGMWLPESAVDTETLMILSDFGIEFTTNQCKELLKAGVPGLHFYTMNRSSSALGIIKNLQKDGFL